MNFAAPFGRATRKALARLDRLSRGAKTMIVVAFDLVVLTIVSFTAFVLRFAGQMEPTEYQVALLLLAPPITCTCLYALRAYRNVVRLHASNVEGGIAMAIGASALIWAFLILVLGAEGFPRSVIAMYGGLSTIVYIAFRRTIAGLFWPGHIRRTGTHEIKNVAIFGVNQFGSNLAENLRRGGTARPVAFVDAGSENVGRRVSGLPVIALEDLHSEIEALDIDMVVLAMTQSSRQKVRALLEQISQLNVKVQTIAPPEDILSGRVSISDIRPVKLEDVLGRDPIMPRRDLMERAVAGKRMLVTGAGGSIGSELVRQALGFAPKVLVLFEMSEVALYAIEREAQDIVAASGARVKIIPVLSSVCDAGLVRRTLAQYKTEVVLHAAAYKHVPLGEVNAGSYLVNNVFGTQVLADCSIEAGVELFVLISSDKAVRPTNIMGASKRMSELVLQDRAQRQPSTTFTMVRFGNVLGSSGSVIPLFREQIAKGGPLTVTDPNVVRYFMTISEAVELVLQAAGMAHGGEVFVLDMGQPVRIDNLARTLVSLSNLTVRDSQNPNGDIEIAYTGLRPGEKMYEELLIGDNVVETEHPRIMRCLERSVTTEALDRSLAKLRMASSEGDEAAIRDSVRDAVEEFEPSAGQQRAITLAPGKEVSEILCPRP